MVVSLALTAYAEPYHRTSDAVGYKCIFNHELLIISHNKTNSASYIKSFIKKLKVTDMDAVSAKAAVYAIPKVGPCWR